MLCKIPIDCLYEIVRFLPDHDVLSVLLINKDLYQKINREAFWKSKGVTLLYPTYKESYRYYGTVDISSNKNMKLVDVINEYKSKSKYIKIAASTFYAAFLDTHNDLFLFGSNLFHQLGLSDKSKQFNKLHFKVKDVSCSYYCTMVIDMNDYVWMWGRYVNTILEPTNLQIKAKKIICGNDINGIINMNNELVVLSNTSIHFNKKVKDICISCGVLSAIDMDNNVWSTSEDNTTDLIDVRIKAKKYIYYGDYTLFIDMNDTLFYIGSIYFYNDSSLESSIKLWEGVKNVECSSDCIMVIDQCDNVWKLDDEIPFKHKFVPLDTKARMINCTQNMTVILK
jgi:alpha-tubulin suppressor-like RCC1 family protein